MHNLLQVQYVHQIHIKRVLDLTSFVIFTSFFIVILLDCVKMTHISNNGFTVIMSRNELFVLWVPSDIHSAFCHCLITKFLKCFKAVRFRFFREPDNRNWKSSDIRVPVNNFVKHINTPECIKITNTSFSCFIRVIINMD